MEQKLRECEKRAMESVMQSSNTPPETSQQDSIVSVEPADYSSASETESDDDILVLRQPTVTNGKIIYISSFIFLSISIS